MDTASKQVDREHIRFKILINLGVMQANKNWNHDTKSPVKSFDLKIKYFSSMSFFATKSSQINSHNYENHRQIDNKSNAGRFTNQVDRNQS